MVLAQNGEIKQALMYQPYGTIAPVAGIPGTGSDPLRQKFTTKEFDEDGENSENGAPGIQAYHFGARVYDPDIGIWLSTDPSEQFWSTYLYCASNPVMVIDPNGEYGWFTWSIGKDGLQIGWQFANGMGFYSRFGWGDDGFSYGTGVSYGVNVSNGIKLSAGAQLGTTWHARGNEWTQDASVSAGVGFGGEGGGLGIGGSLNLSYSYNHKTWTPGWGVNAGLSSNGGTIGGSVNYGGDFKGNNAWSWGANGQFVADYSDFGIGSKYEEIEGLTMERIEAWDSDDGFGHYWIESDGKGYGFWPEGDGATPKEAIFNKKPGVLMAGDDPHARQKVKAHYASITKSYKVYAPKGNGAAYYKDQLQGVPASHFGKQYGIPFGKNCHTYYRSFVNRNGLITVRK